MVSSRQRTLGYRNEVTLYLQSLGLPVSTPTGSFDDIDALFPGNGGHVVGLKNLSVLVRCQVNLDLSGAVAAAEELALREGTSLFAAVVHHRGRGTEDSYAVMPLRVLAAMQTQLHPGEVSA